ncbi:MAG TPA: ATP-binding protein, partial [Myxococcota bacterium]|nr:ATP-binding protein [Myxococcota bacterium]
ELTRRLLAFARRQPLEPRAVDVNRLVASMEDLLRRTLGEHIEIAFEPGETAGPALVDPGQLESALLNLCVNSRDAMPDGGRLAIRTGHGRLEGGGSADVQPGEYVVLEVTDTGSGIPSENLGRVFEPFFTTKPVGRGTGLGLAMVYGFLKQSGGHVELDSAPGRGTAVKLYLPRAGGVEPGVEAGAPQAQALGGAETILLVEDEEQVRLHAQRQLAALGYRVLAASNGREALELLREHSGIDLLFTDVVMPGGIDGRQLAEEARRMHPGLKVLFTSGYSEDVIVHHGRLDAGLQLLPKPYRSAELARKVRLALDAPPPR